MQAGDGIVRLSGELRIAQLDQDKTATERCESPVMLDLEEVDLIDLEGVRFLNACEAKGIAVLRCSHYIREWMLQEQRHRSEKLVSAKEPKEKKENKNDSQINANES